MPNNFPLLLALSLSVSSLACAAEPQTIVLWPQGAPGAVGETEADRPSLTVWLAPPDQANGAAVVICPGGGYGNLAVNHEGRDVAIWLNSLGVSAFMLKYRLGPRYRHPAPLTDAQRAIRTVRANAKEWKLDPQRVGIMGFSAGGHLASTVATHFDRGKTDSSDPIEQASCRPDFAILCYPVISFTAPYTHRGSLRNLLGENPDPQLVQNLSNETQVTSETPPTFLMHTNADAGVPPENSVAFYLALRKAGVPAELHIYEQGRHGLGLAPDVPAVSTWPARLADWLRVRGVLKRE
jgi:acetyl esterase/lipase